MKCQDLFSPKNKIKKKIIKNCRLLQIVLGALRINHFSMFNLAELQKKAEI